MPEQTIPNKSEKQAKVFITNTIIEAEKKLGVTEQCDVIVCGGGPAGVAAAIAAARQGAKTALIEARGCLGGIWTAGLMSWIIDDANKDGVMKEISDRLKRSPDRSCNKYAYDIEQTKLELERMCVEAGVRVRLHTRVCAVQKNGDDITHIITESKSGREAWTAKAFIDATGDGDLSAQAGCSFDFGRDEKTGECQPMSLIAIFTGVKLSDIHPYVNGVPGNDWLKSKEALKKIMEAGGASPSYAVPTIFAVHEDVFLLMANHQYGAKGTNAADLTRATIEAREEVHALIEALRKNGGIWNNIRLIATSEHIGVREGRRINGLYQVGIGDLVTGIRHEDAVCRASFGIDIHSTNPDKSKAIDCEQPRTKPYDIPLRALIAKDIKNLFIAGRCISGDFFAHASYRVTGNSVALGEASGIAAAISAEKGINAHTLEWEQVKPFMTKIRE